MVTFRLRFETLEGTFWGEREEELLFFIKVVGVAVDEEEEDADKEDPMEARIVEADACNDSFKDDFGTLGEVFEFEESLFSKECVSTEGPAWSKESVGVVGKSKERCSVVWWLTLFGVNKGVLLAVEDGVNVEGLPETKESISSK